MLNRWRTVVKWLVVVSVVCFSAVSLVAAQSGPRVDLLKVDASHFPLIRLNLAVRDEEGSPVLEPAGLTVTENGNAVASVDVDSVVVGAETVFVIDANDTIRVRDVSSGPTRLEKVRDSIVGFSTNYMNQSHDRVSIVVPDDTGETGQFLLENGVFPNEVINEINFYAPPNPPDDAPLQAMLQMALRRLEQNKGEGRFQAIVLFTDGANLPNEIEDMAAIAQQAQALGVPIYTLILGARADPNEVENVLQLSEPTTAFYLHMPEPAAAEPLYEILRGYQSQTQVQYRSTAAESGSHTVAVTVEGATVSAVFEVTVEPPTVEITVDNSQPIRRVAAEADSELAEMEPAEQPIAARVEWPDGHPREVAAVTLVVNGEEMAMGDADTSVVLSSGVLTFDWDISELDEGEYELVVQVTDELGLVGASEALPLTIEIERPAAAPAATSAVDEPAEAETETATDGETESGTVGGLPPQIAENLPLIGIVVGVLAIFGSLFILFLAVLFIRRRRLAPAEPAGLAPSTPAVPGVQPLYNPPMDHDATQVILPDFIARSMASAHLEPLENAPGHSGTIPITGNNIAIGRDAKLAQIVFSDKSVSRLHARIMESGGTYRIYDEGSASGTYLNYERIGLQPQPLKDNDEIHIGRVHLRFHVTQAMDVDSTQVMGAPQRPGRPAGPAPTPALADEELGTQPYMPNQPQGPGRIQPPSSSSDNPPDDVSTQPYMPHSPKR